MKNDAIEEPEQLQATISRLSDERDNLADALRYYADTFCEFSTDFEGCGKLHEDQCSGCRARAALSRLIQT